MSSEARACPGGAHLPEPRRYRRPCRFTRGTVGCSSTPLSVNCLEDTGDVFGVGRLKTRLLQADRGEPVERGTLSYCQPARLELLGRHIPLLAAIERADSDSLAARDRHHPERLAFGRLDRLTLQRRQLVPEGSGD